MPDDKQQKQPEQQPETPKPHPEERRTHDLGTPPPKESPKENPFKNPDTFKKNVDNPPLKKNANGE